MYTRILVPVDGSVASLKGLDEAIKLAKAMRAQIKLLHVLNDLIIDSGYVPSVYIETVIVSMRKSGEQVLAAAQALVAEQGVALESEMAERIGGQAADSIIEAAQQWSADLIVMGTHGRRGLRRLALGSDAELVLRTSSVPVLMVRSARET